MNYVLRRGSFAAMTLCLFISMGGCIDGMVRNSVDKATKIVKEKFAEEKDAIIAAAKEQAGKIIASAKEESARILQEAADKNMENLAEGSTEKDEEGEYKTTIAGDVLNMVNGGAGIGSILFYLFWAFVSWLAHRLGAKGTEKKMGGMVEVRNAALKLMTGKINKLAKDGKFFGVGKMLVDSIERSAGRHTGVGGIIHDAAKDTDHHREGNDLHAEVTLSARPAA